MVTRIDPNKKIPDLLEACLRPDGSCKYPEEEAILIRDFAAVRLQKIAPEYREIAEVALQQIELVVAAYRDGRIKNRSEDSIAQDEERAVGDINHATTSPELGLVPAEKFQRIDLPSCLEEALEDALPISRMDWNALKQHIPVGSIDPPAPHMIFVAGNLRTPTPAGHLNRLTLEWQEEEDALFVQLASSPIATSSDPAQINIVYPIKTEIVPLPIEGTVISVVAPSTCKISTPGDSDPLVVRLEESTNSLAFSTKPTEHTNYYTLAPEVYPSLEEQRYLQQLLRLPSDVDARMRNSQTSEDKVHIVISYLGSREPDSQYSLFRYVAHPAFGEFIRENASDQTLIMSELKVGHCDLLSWYSALILRAYGTPAWSLPVRVPIENGSAFNGAFSHAVTAFLGWKGNIGYFDATECTDPDPAYHPAALPAVAVKELRNVFKNTENIGERVVELRRFKEQVDKARVHASKNPEIAKDMGFLIGGLGGGFQTCIDASVYQKEKVKAVVAPFRERPIEQRFQRHTELAEYCMNLLQVDYNFMSPDALTTLQDRPTARSFLREFLKISLDEGLYVGFRNNPNWKLQFHYLNIAAFDRLKYDNASAIEKLDSQVLASIDSKRFFSLLDSIRNLQGPNSAQFFLEICRFNKNNLTKIVPKDHSMLQDYEYCAETRSRFSYAATHPSEGPRKMITNDAISIDEIGIQASNDFIYFFIQLQHALTSPKYRQVFLNMFSASEETLQIWVKDLCDWGPVHKRKKEKAPYSISEDWKRHVQILKETLFIPSDQRARFAAKLARIMQRNTERGSIKSFDDLRSYSAGDDLRHLDWNAFARFEQLVVRQAPVNLQDIHSPMYLLIDAYMDDTMHKFQVVLFIEAMQRLAKDDDREIYLSHVQTNAYHRLSPTEDPYRILARICSETLMEQGGIKYEDRNINPVLLGGKAPKNLFFISDDYSHILGMKYLLGHASRLTTLYLDDPEFILYPLARPEWVKNGLSANVTGPR